MFFQKSVCVWHLHWRFNAWTKYIEGSWSSTLSGNLMKPIPSTCSTDFFLQQPFCSLFKHSLHIALCFWRGSTLCLIRQRNGRPLLSWCILLNARRSISRNHKRMVAFTCQRIVSDCTRGFTSKSDRWKIRSRDCISLQCGACRILDLDSNARIVFQSVALNQRTGCALNADSRMLAFFLGTLHLWKEKLQVNPDMGKPCGVLRVHHTFYARRCKCMRKDF